MGWFTPKEPKHILADTRQLLREIRELGYTFPDNYTWFETAYYMFHQMAHMRDEIEQLKEKVRELERRTEVPRSTSWPGANQGEIGFIPPIST